MSASPETLELLAWISGRPRTYDGLLQVVRDGRDPHVELTSLGRATLDRS